MIVCHSNYLTNLNMMKKITGGCHCRNIVYEAQADLNKTLICHCTDCQIMSGSAFRTIVFVPEHQFTHLGEKPKQYIKIADSGNKRAMNFCGICGSHIYACDLDDTSDSQRVFGIRLGTCDQRKSIKPYEQYYCKSKLPWVDDINSIQITD